MPRYKVIVDDNFHYQDPHERREQGVYETVEEALAVCRGLVDKSLKEEYRSGISRAVQAVTQARHRDRAVRRWRADGAIAGRGAHPGRLRDIAVGGSTDQGRSPARSCSNQRKAYRATSRPADDGRSRCARTGA